MIDVAGFEALLASAGSQFMLDRYSGFAGTPTGRPDPAAGGTETVALCRPRAAAGDDLPPGTVVAGRFEVQGLLGRGGYGVVYEARDRARGRVVALKVLRADRSSRGAAHRFRREAQLVRHLDHPRLVRVYDTGSEGDRLYLTMERIRGESLEHRLRRGPLGVAEAVGVAVQLAEALEVLHRAGLVHRDVKPANVLLDTCGQLKLADFGLTRCAGDEAAGVTRAGNAVGTAAYMAPEEALGEPLDARTDLYALGVVLYEMLAGVPPHRGKTPLGTLLAHLQHPAPDVRRARPEVPAWLARVVSRLLARQPRDRHASARSLRDDLLAGLVGQRGAPAPLRRGATIAAALALAGCALAIAF